MVRLSALQFEMLRTVAEDINRYMSIDAARRYDQRPFRSMLVREYLAYIPGKGFRITETGRTAWHDFRHQSISRKNPALPLTAYFDPVAYGLAAPKKKRNAA
jgi:hypothetical protein